jgi:hypothetical protein
VRRDREKPGGLARVLACGSSAYAARRGGLGEDGRDDGVLPRASWPMGSESRGSQAPRGGAHADVLALEYGSGRDVARFLFRLAVFDRQFLEISQHKCYKL